MKIELGPAGKIAFSVGVILSLIGLAACGNSSPNAIADQTPFATSSLVPLSSPTPENTPQLKIIRIRNPFTGVYYTIDQNGCAVIPTGGTAYGAATILGDPKSATDVSPLQFVYSNGMTNAPVQRPNDLPTKVHANDKVCPAPNGTPTPAAFIHGSGRMASIGRGFSPDTRSSKTAFSKSISVFRRI